MVKYFKEKMVNDMKRKAIYKLSFKEYLKAMMLFIVFMSDFQHCIFSIRFSSSFLTEQFI